MADANVTKVVDSEKETKIMDNKLIFNADGKLIGITDEEVTRLAELYGKAIDWCGIYPHCTKIATENTIRKWFANKAWIIELMAKDPDYNGDYAVVKNRPIQRSVDSYSCNDFLKRVTGYTGYFKTPYVLNGHTYMQIFEELENLENEIYHAEKILDKFPILSEFIAKETEEKAHWNSEVAVFRDMCDKGELYYDGDTMYDMTVHKNVCNIKDIFNYIRGHLSPTVDKNMEDYINERFPKFKAKEGQKTSRVVNKLCSMLGIDKISYEWLQSHGYSLSEFGTVSDKTKNAYNPLFAQFADAINPFEKDKQIFLSVHPVHAFIAQSWGVKWTSCHTPDKENKHGYPSDSGATYHGMYASGPISYMLDPSTICFYINGKDAEARAEEMGEPSPRKEMRQLFHIGKQKFIQGRLYPYDQTDRNRSVEPEAYKQYRAVVQEFLATAWNVSNLWQKNLRGSSECRNWEYSYGTHYKDYENYSNVNVSLLKGMTNNERISIGCKPICPSCGRVHTTQDNLFCSYCRSGDITTPTPQFFDILNVEIPLGSIGNGDGDGEEEVETHYCAYHGREEEYSEDEMHYITNYGWVCDDALDSGDFTTCERCGEIHYNPDGDAGCQSNEDEVWFCCERCAHNDGYYYLERYDDYIHEDDFEYSEIDNEDLMPSDDDTCYAIYNENGCETIALRDSCTHYNGDWYDSDIMEYVDGEYYPEFLLVDVYRGEYDTYRMLEDEAEYNDDIYLINGEYYDGDIIVETVDGDLLPLWWTVEYEDEYYDIDDCTWIDGVRVPKIFTTVYNGIYYLKRNCIWVDDDLVPINMSEMNEVA